MLTSRTFAVNHTTLRQRTPETTLYAPVKRYLEALGFTVKGEVCGCELVALRGEEPPIVVIGELKLAFSLELVLQGVDQTAATRSCLPCVWPGVEDRLRPGQHFLLRLRDRPSRQMTLDGE